MKVYVLREHDHENEPILGVFSTEEGLEKRRQEIITLQEEAGVNKWRAGGGWGAGLRTEEDARRWYRGNADRALYVEEFEVES